VEIRSFRPIIYSNHVDEAVAPPFDTISRHQKESLLRTPYNITHVTTLSRDNFRDAPKIMRRWMDEGILKKLDRECMIILEQEFRSMGEKLVRIGVISLVSIEDGWEQIKPHENTFRWAVDERKELMKESGCQLEPIFLAVASNSFENLLRRMIQEICPDLEFEEPLGVINKAFFIYDPDKIKKIQSVIRNDDAIVADGHHRFQAIKELLQEEGSGGKEKWSSVFAYTTSIYDRGLMISGIHRIVSTSFSFKNVIEKIGRYFNITVKTGYSDESHMVLYKDKFYVLIPKDSVNRDLGIASDDVDESNPRIINDLIFREMLGMSSRTIEEEISFTQDESLAINAVDNHEAEFAIIMPAWSKDTFINLTRRGHILPQKSTYFYPKIPSGIAIYCK
jgi:uncharacterized protein (DUF1015 family)